MTAVPRALLDTERKKGCVDSGTRKRAYSRGAPPAGGAMVAPHDDHRIAMSFLILGLAAKPASNTAVAAQALADPTNAVLASEFAAKAYGLTILKRDMQDHPDNSTIFVVLAKEGR